MHARRLRALRGASAGTVATLLAATSHTIAGGGAPSPALVFALAVLSAPLSVALVGRTLSVWRVALTVIASQTLFHGVFSLTAAGVRGDDAAGISHLHSGAHHSLVTFDASSKAFVIPDSAMLVSHLAAAVLTLLALYFGERMLRRIARGVRSVLARAEVGAALEVVTRRPLSSPVVVAVAMATALSDVSRRGPPLLVTAAH
ncbi:hypothetical protein [Microbacterium sp. C7(2022)]|uniref:hypothetical protein n=1 Tax=Microbacterium sp. C7(2022) TaxID=2992759 RepID=UPI00237A4053|nr:hypothetical protein [Microbacterium sp. C7(2022)]MDE0547201.1 hypothetical protein [Microbacterium sp. C7(2022)]